MFSVASSSHVVDWLSAVLKRDLPLTSLCLFCVVSRSLQILWVSPSWKPVPRMPLMWSRPSWPWLLKSRKEWGLEPQLEVGKSPTSSWPLALPSSLHREDVAEGETTFTLTPETPLYPSKAPCKQTGQKRHDWQAHVSVEQVRLPELVLYIFYFHSENEIKPPPSTSCPVNDDHFEVAHNWKWPWLFITRVLLLRGCSFTWLS